MRCGRHPIAAGDAYPRPELDPTPGQPHIFWANSGLNGDSIEVANLDGTGVNQDFITGVVEVCGVATDGTHLYWPNAGAGDGTTIGRANLDGTGVNQSLTTGAQARCGFAFTH